MNESVYNNAHSDSSLTKKESALPHEIVLLQYWPQRWGDIALSVDISFVSTASFVRPPLLDSVEA